MIVTDELKKDIEKRFLKVLKDAKNREDKLFSVLKDCTEDEAICLKYLYCYMNEQDLANCDGELFLKFVRHSLMLREVMPWKEYLKDEMFLNYVLQYRVNNESVEFYSKDLYDELLPLIKGKSMYEAVLEINYWCFSKATYQATDGRTVSPLGIIRRAYGRCGEESTFTVASLRAMGIPARQVYSPRWAHCDDNHAWGEAYVDGEWHFLGACEPEPVLDTGWFMLSASKGMLTNTRVASHNIKDEEIVLYTDNSTEINTLKRYADTKRIYITVKDTKGNLVKDAKVRFEVVNYSEFFPLTELTTDEKGEASLLTGLGDLLIYVCKDGKAVYNKIDVRETDKMTLVLPEAFVKEENGEIIHLVPPKGKSPDENKISDEMKKAHEEKNAKCLEKRKAFESTFYDEQKAKEWSKTYAPYDEEIAKALENARGNFAEIINFIEDLDTKDYIKEKAGLFSTLNKKDFCDITCDILKSHLIEAMPYKDKYSEEIFTKYLLAPRILLEMITPYKTDILSYFDEKTKDEFLKNPTYILDYINKNIETKPKANSSYFSNPIGLLELGYGREISKKLLFVAICRALGVPAKVNSEDYSLEYFKDGKWASLLVNNTEILKTSKLTLKGSEQFDYYKNYTVGKLKNGFYSTLHFSEDEKWENEKISYIVEEGRYRIVVSDRDAEGRLAIKMFFTDIAKDEEKVVPINIEKCNYNDGKEVDIKDVQITLKDKEKSNLSKIIKDDKNMVAYLDVGAEPTEHLLNELLDSSEKFNAQGINVILFVQKETDLQNKTLIKTINEIPKITMCIGYEREDLDDIYKGFDITDKKLPLVYTMSKPMKAQNAWAGYNVGVGEMILKFLN